MTSPRDIIVQRLAEDLIGPAHVDEWLESRPSDVYLTGILWPKNTALSPEEDDHLAQTPGAGEAGEEADDQAQPPATQMRRPSTAGISFAARADHSAAPRVVAFANFAVYEKADRDGKHGWQRLAVEAPPIPIELAPGVRPYKIEVPGIDGVHVHVRCVPFPDGMLATATLVNASTPAGMSRDETESATLFQVALRIEPDTATRLIARPSRRAIVDAEDRSMALLFRDAHEYAAGHTCSAEWVFDNDGNKAHVRYAGTTWMPSATTTDVSSRGAAEFHALGASTGPLSAATLASADPATLPSLLSRLPDAYAAWIAKEKLAVAGLDKRYTATAEEHLKQTDLVCERMRGGIRRLADDAAAMRAFQLANLAMNTQRLWGGSPPLVWRPFQLGFLLLALDSTIDGEHPDREVMDLLWFPTGGGKTEAYLGLVALVAFYRRLSRTSPDEGGGVACIMRYTLRLLTTQQFTRAAAMICACEAIRRGTVDAPSREGLGETPFSIGLWVGGDATPNSRKDAYASLNDPSRSSPRQLADCPCCGQRLDYVQQRPADSVHIFCRTNDCALSGTSPLPVWTVDEDVYSERPTMLIGTVDKFAQIVRKRETAQLFAVGERSQPQLILQDELHLISGPLGTLVGLYESALDIILSAGGTRPKIIGSTATIRRAADQVSALFDRKVCQFPPPGLNASDSGFAIVDPDAHGRRYVGISTAGRSAKFVLQAVSASLLQAASCALTEAERDPYWTLVAYFNSLRELGGALVLMQDDVSDTLRLLADRRGETPRPADTIQELTSRRSQVEIGDMLRQMEVKAGDDGALDAVLATNMLSVGVDIRRLGLMLVNGQPKTMAEYIQSTSRVGRGGLAGLVVPVLNNAKPRDRSHFETFNTWHSMLYRDVEATSVTPFASRARDRALHAVLVAVVRHRVPGMLTSPGLVPQAEARARQLIDLISARAHAIDPLETEVGPELHERLDRWIRLAPEVYWQERNAKRALMQSAEEAATKKAAGRLIGQAWPTPNTMRGVEPSTPFRLTYLKKATSNAS